MPNRHAIRSTEELPSISLALSVKTGVFQAFFDN